MTNNWFQNFFDTKPVLAGIVLALIISGIVFIIFGIYYLFRRSKNKKIKEKTKNEKVKSTNSNDEKKINEDLLIVNFRLNIDKNGKLVIRKDKESDDDYKLVESRETLLQIIGSKNDNLLLPDGKISILESQDYNNEKQNESKISRKKRFSTSSPQIFDNNLYVYKTFLRYMDDDKYTWLRSKFN